MPTILKKKNKGKTDWNRVNHMKDEEIDLSDCPEVTEQMVQKGNWRIRMEPNMISIDPDILLWFKQSKGEVQTHVNAALRKYIELVENYQEHTAR